MRDHHDGLAEFAVQLLQQGQDFIGGFTIQIAGRLVAIDQRIGHQGTGNRDTLLLATG